MTFTDILNVGKAAEDRIRKQEGGTHADELETSMMLYMHPEFVDMSKAVKDYHPGAGGSRGTRPPPFATARSGRARGVFGDATLATARRARILVEAQVDGHAGRDRGAAPDTDPLRNQCPSFFAPPDC